jgi:hypothetical protein
VPYFSSIGTNINRLAKTIPIIPINTFKWSTVMIVGPSRTVTHYHKLSKKCCNILVCGSMLSVSICVAVISKQLGG